MLLKQLVGTENRITRTLQRSPDGHDLTMQTVEKVERQKDTAEQANRNMLQESTGLQGQVVTPSLNVNAQTVTDQPDEIFEEIRKGQLPLRAGESLRRAAMEEHILRLNQKVSQQLQYLQSVSLYIVLRLQAAVRVQMQNLLKFDKDTRVVYVLSRCSANSCDDDENLLLAHCLAECDSVDSPEDRQFADVFACVIPPSNSKPQSRDMTTSVTERLKALCTKIKSLSVSRKSRAG